MCEALRELMREDLEEERENTILVSIRNLMDSMKWTAEQTMDALKLSMDERAKYVSRL